MVEIHGAKLGLAVFAVGIGLIAGALAQHPFLGPNYPAQDPRSGAERSLQGSASRAVEFGYWLGVESCAFRARGRPNERTPFYVDAWALGVERWERDKVLLFFETRIVERTGAPLAIERPTLYMFWSGPTYDWRPGRTSADGYVRIEKELSATSGRERLGFVNSVREQGVRELAITLPDGRGDAYISLHDGATERQFEFFATCVCNLLGTEARGLFRCP